jgi:hypothetical protein
MVAEVKKWVDRDLKGLWMDVDIKQVDECGRDTAWTWQKSRNK